MDKQFITEFANNLNKSAKFYLTMAKIGDQSSEITAAVLSSIANALVKTVSEQSKD